MTKNNEDEYMEMVRTTGSFIDTQFLEDVLGDTLNDKDIKVLDHSYTAAVMGGNNYLGVLYKTIVKYKTRDSKDEQTRHLMIKGPPAVGPFVSIKPTIDAFQKEVSMYNSCLSAMHKVLRDHFPEDTPKVAPESYRCKRENTIVMENLQVSGYEMKPRREQLDFDHLVVTLQTLARFHALSAKVFDRNPDIIINVGKECFYAAPYRPYFEPLIQPCLPALADEAEGWGECAKYAQEIRDMSTFIWEKLEALVLPSRYFNVLGHGDLWTNNMMFKYLDNGKIHSCKFVDFQFSRFSTPILDVLYVLFTSGQPAVVSNHMFELFNIYHDALMSDLMILGISVDYSIRRLYQDARERAAYILIVISMFLPAIISPTGGTDFEQHSENVNKKPNHLMPMETQSYAETASKLLLHTAKLGYIQDARVYTQHIEDAARRSKEVDGNLQSSGAISYGRLRTAKLTSTVWFAFEEIFED